MITTALVSSDKICCAVVHNGKGKVRSYMYLRRDVAFIEPDMWPITARVWIRWITPFEKPCRGERTTEGSSTPLICWSRRSCWSGAHCKQPRASC